MGLQELKNYLDQSCPYYLNTRDCAPGDIGCMVDEHSPAAITPNKEAQFWTGMDPQKRIQAEAHELGHLLLNHHGLYRFEYTMPTFNWFNMYFNNVIHHRHLIEALRAFEIGSDYHLSLMAEYLEPGTIALFDPDWLVEFGVVLADVANTIPAREQEALAIVHRNNKVLEGFSAARRFLVPIEVGWTFDQEFQAVGNFLEELHLNRQRLRMQPMDELYLRRDV